MIQELYKEALSASDMDVVIAPNGEKGIERAQKKKPDLILLDLLLPGISGLAVLEQLSSNETAKDIPIMILTNYHENGLTASLKKMGVVDLMFKYKTSPEEVVKRIKDFLKTK